MFLLYFPFFLIEIIFFKLFKKPNSEKSYQFFLKSFSNFGPISNYLINNFLKQKKVSLENLATNNTINFNKKSQDKIVTNIKKNGFYSLEGSLGSKTIDKINFFLKNTRGYYISENLKSNEKVFLDENNPKSVQFIYKTEDLLQSNEIQKIICDKKIISIAQDYLGCLPIFDFLSMYWSFDSKIPDKEAAQYWHFDMDRPRWLKVFFYLTEVNKNNGPHMFIPGTHLLGKKFPSQFRKRGYVRLLDEEINQVFSKEAIKTFCLPKGSILFEDTSGLHKGLKLNFGKRLLFMIQFSSSTFGARKYGGLNKIKINEVCEEFRKAKSNYGDIFPNITI
jgi:hypothetical protein